MSASAYAFLRQLIWLVGGEFVFAEGGIEQRMEKGNCLELGPLTDSVFINSSSALCVYAVVVLSSSLSP